MDVLHDNSYRTWYHIAEACGTVPQYVGDYAPLNKAASDELVDTLYADPGRRLFPIEDKGSTWLSAAYFAWNRDNLPYTKVAAEAVYRRILEAADIFDISKDVREAMDKIAEHLKQADPIENDGNYGWVAEADGRKIRRYPMFDRQGVLKAAAYFDENRREYPASVRKTIATNILRKAAEYVMPHDSLPLSVVREAGAGVPVKEQLMEELLERAHLAKDAELAIKIAQINEALFSAAPKELASTLEKLAGVVEQFDQLEGLAKLYGNKVMYPADFLYSLPDKEAEEFVKHAVQLGNLVFDITKLAELSTQVYEAPLGPDFVASIVDGGTVHIEKLAAALQKLSQEDKIALEEHLVRMFS